MFQVGKRVIVVLIALSSFLSLFSSAYGEGWLGITIEPPNGVQIGEIIKGGPADLAGLKNRDIIQTVNENPVLSMGHFIRTISQMAPKQEVVLGLLRQGKNLQAKVILDDRKNHLSVSQTPLQQLPSGMLPSSSAFRSWMDQSGSDFPGSLYPLPTVATPAPEPAPQPAAWLGIAPGLSDKSGVLVKGVAKDSPGELAGLKPGDLVISINGQALSSPASLVRLMDQLEPGELVVISLTREGKIINLQAKMANNPAQPTP